MSYVMRWTFVLALIVISPIAAAQGPCPTQSLPPAIDSLAPVPAAKVLTFAATPSLEHPGRAWVVHLYRRGLGAGMLEIVRLRRQAECNRYDVEKRWKASLTAEEYQRVMVAVAPLGTPPSDAFTHDDRFRGLEEGGIDGTGIVLRLETTGWNVTRELHHSARTGAMISAFFHALLAKHVSAAELPTDDWRTRSGG